MTTKSPFPRYGEKGLFVKFCVKALCSPSSGNDDDHKNHEKDNMCRESGHLKYDKIWLLYELFYTHLGKIRRIFAKVKCCLENMPVHSKYWVEYKDTPISNVSKIFRPLLISQRTMRYAVVVYKTLFSLENAWNP